MQDNYRQGFKYTDAISTDDDTTSHGKLFALVGKGERVLEFGSGTGLFAEALRDRLSCQVTGVELSGEAVEISRPRLHRVISADAEGALWEEALGDELFDTIVLSDILEHLKDPRAFLRRAEKHLIPEGKLIFSVPNVAHADLLSALWDNRFDYTEKGLLDNTHLHHFTEKALSGFFADAGLFLYHLDATVCESGATEQSTAAVSPAVRRVMRERPFAMAYQFVGAVCKRAYAERMGRTFRSVIPPEASGDAIRVYFDPGEGFSAENSLSIPSPHGEDAATVLLSEDTVRLRLCVRDEPGYLIYAPRFLLGGQEVLPTEVLGMVAMGDGYLITESNAAFIFSVAKGDGVFSFTGSISVLADDLGWNYLLGAQKALAQSDAILAAVTKEKDAQIAENAAIKEELAALQKDFDRLKHEHHTVLTSRSWRSTRPVRGILDGIKRLWHKSAFFALVHKGLRYLRRHGFRAAWRKLRDRRHARKQAKKSAQYSEELLRQQRNHKFSRDCLFSILVPLYNTPKQFLLEMIASVQAQTYASWELCLADGSDEAHASVGETCLKLSERDPRIKYKKLEKNLGISGNTNACIDMATGNYIALFDHDDLLHPAALYEMMRAIEKGADFVYTDESTFHDHPKDAYCPHFKPDYAPDTLRANNYICHFNAFSRELLEAAGKYFRPECDGSQDYDMMLRLTEKAKKIVHIPIVLYYWRAHRGSVATDVAAKPYVIEAAHRALADHLKRVGLEGEVLDTVVPSMYRIKYKIHGTPKVSIIIANKDHIRDLDLCLRSIEEKTTYPNYEIVIVENNSTESETFLYYETLKDKPNVRVVTWGDGKATFNYSAINNFGVKHSDGAYIILLNNDIEILTPEWIEEMLMFAQREDVGEVGAKLYYPDDTVQHAGVGIGLLTLAGHYHKHFPRRHPGYMGRLIYAHNVSAVTAALVMVPRRVWDEVDGLDEGYAVAFNDIDLSMKIRDKGYLIVFTPFAEAYHYESKSRGIEDTPAKRARFESEINRFYSKWRHVLGAGDPYYNPNFSLDSEDFRIR